MKKSYVTLISYFSIGAFILMLFGFLWTIQSQFVDKGTPVKEQTEKELPVTKSGGKVIVAVGDSLTRGTGDEEGKGYIGYLVEELEEKSKEKITLYNYGVKGYQSQQLLSQLKGQRIQDQIKEADVIVMTIGGNDLFQGGKTVVNPNEEAVTTIRTQYLENLKQSMELIKSLNQEASVYLLGLYNPFIDLEDAQTTTSIVREWNFTTSQLLDQYPNAVLVPTFDLFQIKVNDYLFSDKFHPNNKGYHLIAERVASLITW